jgi:7,8-dihydropterin-6-yl-methyl-4-(beta-D-ribofuranosyl)aminobenzene 5'-phosphate synthase
MNLKRAASLSSLVILAFTIILVSYLMLTFFQGVKEVESEWLQDKPNKIYNVGSTKTLSILPLVNWHISNDKFKGEAGVSYLIKTDTQTILFDVGFNQHNESPSPLQHNMAKLGIKLEDIDTLFLSHHHLDHSGGQSWVNKNTFSLGTEQVDLSDKNIYATSPIEYPNLDVTINPQASVIGQGAASIGGISRQLFMGRIKEQALAINVEGKGLVLIVGCGHQTLPKILARTQRVFNQPIYGLVGDLHYPVPTGRLSLLGINLQRIFASGDGPLEPIDKQTIDNELAMLKDLNMGLVALGGHDTSDEVIEIFHQEFMARYQYVQVGKPIIVAQ